jgi:two-component system response regulator HydG
MNEKPKILVVDDEESHRIMLRAVLTADGYRVAEAADGTEAVRAVEKEAFDIILLDVRMTNMDGIEALTEIRKISPLVPVLIMTAYASVKTAVEALKAGAFDYMTKPLDIEEVKILIEKALEHYHLRTENLTLKERLGDRFDFSRIICRSGKMKILLDTLAMVAPSDATVLIIGESGTGKEVVANAIHHNSPRAGQPFIKVSCAALPETLLESELFGHEKGAFTGAVSRREGRFQLAHRGTIFLDEVGEMNPAIQTKLLRVLQEKEFEPLGSARTIKVDIRVIAATNKDLTKEVKEGRFREDLYYRLNVVPITMPPLRDRKEDIPPLADHFLSIFREKNRKPLKGISGKAQDLLVRYDWPGNIRELENCIERAVRKKEAVSQSLTGSAWKRWKRN